MAGELLIWGAGGHAAVVADLARLAGWHVAAFVDDRPGSPGGTQRWGVPVVGAAQAEALVRGGVRHAAVAVGDPRVRLAKAALLQAWGAHLVPLVHPRAVVAESAELGPGTVVCAGAVVAPLARLGRLCVVNTLASADHECDLADGVHLAPGARLAGVVRAGVGAWIGVGACVRDHLRLGDWCFVGAGAAVVADLPAGCLAVGVPARPRGRSPYAPPDGAPNRPQAA
jgi:sugar O-acyltransferase (sialic acid O-acetyltransferase NeuD family)